MNVIIENNNNLLSIDELENLLKLLDSAHSDCIRQITLFRNEFDVIRNFKTNFTILLQILKGKFMGFESKGTIYLFPFLLKRFNVKNGDQKLLLAHILFHEVRHAYQNHYLKDKVSEESYSLTSDNYSEQWAEQDANEFAFQLMNENRQHIMHVLGVKESLLFKKKDL